MMKKTHLLLLVSILVLLCGLLTACGKTEQVNLTMVNGDGNEQTVVQIKKGETYTLTEPTREGYAFAGWYMNADFSGAPVTSVKPDADITVYAKWNKLYELTLDPDGGTLSTTKVSLAAGDRISEKIAGLNPEKADCRFGTWLLNGEPLSDDAVMGNENATLVAKYQIKYAAEIFTQNEALDGYDRVSESFVDYGYIGDAVTPSYTLTGFKVVTKSDSVTRLVLSEDTSKNVFRLYFDRQSYTLTFASNYPDGSENTRKTESLTYGIKTKLPFVTFEKAGYYLEGWSLTPNGEMVYSSHVMDGKLYGATIPEVEELTPTGNVTLYAVWSKGYTDLFGGSDIMYISQGEEKAVYLCRGDRYFKGTLINGRTIAFPGANVPADFPDAVLNFDGETFLYKKGSRAEITATLYEMGAGKGLNELVKLIFDDGNGVTYSEKASEDATSTVDSEGTYVFDEKGNLVTTFTSGPLAGKTLIIAVGAVTVNNVRKTAFQVRNEEEIALGRIYHFIVKNNVLVVDADDAGNAVKDLILDGFGIATYNTGSGTSTFYYTYDAESRTITLISQGQVAGVLRLMEVDGTLGYMIYNASNDVTYTLADGSTLTLDGIQTATYTVGGVAHSGYFTVAKSAFGGVILTFTEDGVTYKFMITTKSQEVLVDPDNPGSGTTSTTVTVVEKLVAGYAEYYYKDVEGIYYGPLFVLESEDPTKVTVYGYNKEKQFHKIAVGTLTTDAATGLYLLTVNETFTLPEGTTPVFTEPVDFSKVKTCVLMLDSELTQYSIHFWFNYSDGVETFDKTQVFTGSNGGKLTLVAGFAIYQINGKSEMGVCKQSGDALTVTFADHTLYFTLNTTAMTYTVSTTTAATYAEVGKDGQISKTSYLIIDPVTGVTYCVITVDGETQTVNKYPGTLTRTGTTSLTNFPIYHFESIEKAEGADTPLYSFDFIERSVSTGNYFFRYDEAYAGTFTNPTTNGVLKLDGFGLAATYSDSTGLSLMGMYQKSGNDVMISYNGDSYYFLLSGAACALRGNEYGRAYLMVDNQVFDGLYAEFDGLGHAIIFRLVKNGEEYEREAVDENATYTISGDRVTITYKNGAEAHTITARFGTVASGNNTLYALHTVHDEVVYSYVNEEDWSVLRLNGDGTATKYLADGTVETGIYSLVTETLLYYVNASGTEAYIYTYDTERGTATPRHYDAVAYYTPELDSLLFSQYGFAIFNNSTRYYYTVDENDNVTLYYLDETATNKNRYGYVEENFGTLTDTKSYNEKTYYKNDGFAISFVRADATKDYYPVHVDETNMLPTLMLTFAPTGGENFSVSGTVVIGTKSYNCTVVRETVDGVSKMYFTVATFRFDITIKYQGDGVGSDVRSTYEVTGLTSINTMPSYTYLYYLYYIYSMMGSQYASQFENTFGTVSLYTVYNQDGSAKESYMDATFGKSANLMKSDGTLIEKLEHVALNYLGNGGYRVAFEGGDGYQYSMILVRRYMPVFSTYGYSIYALLREETVGANDGYVVTVDRVVASDVGLSAGAYFSFSLTKDGEKITASNVIMSNGKLYYIVRDESGKTYYYQLTLIEKSSGSLDGGTGEGGTTNPDETTDEKNKPLPPLESATVTKIEATTVRTADGKNYVDILPENQILLMVLTTEQDGKETETAVLVAECNYDAETGVYTLKTSDDKTYTVSITDGVATITETTGTTTEA